MDHFLKINKKSKSLWIQEIQNTFTETNTTEIDTTGFVLKTKYEDVVQI